MLNWVQCSKRRRKAAKTVGASRKMDIYNTKHLQFSAVTGKFLLNSVSEKLIFKLLPDSLEAFRLPVTHQISLKTFCKKSLLSSGVVRKMLPGPVSKKLILKATPFKIVVKKSKKKSKICRSRTNSSSIPGRTS